MMSNVIVCLQLRLLINMWPQPVSAIGLWIHGGSWEYMMAIAWKMPCNIIQVVCWEYVLLQLYWVASGSVLPVIAHCNSNNVATVPEALRSSIMDFCCHSNILHSSIIQIERTCLFKETKRPSKFTIKCLEVTSCQNRFHPVIYRCHQWMQHPYSWDQKIRAVQKILYGDASRKPCIACPTPT